jgi:predicted nucleic acid-binding protein
MDFLLDSNVILDFIGNRLPVPATLEIHRFLQAYSFNSIITRIEVMGYNGSKDEMDKFEEMFGSLIEIELSENIVQKTIHLRKSYQKIKLPDLIIAATALEYNFQLITHNLDDFKSITGLTLIDSYSL